jgi:uncharacterized protein (DUF4415 family)
MKEFDPKHAAKHGYTKADWDEVDSPELTDEQLARAKPFTEASPALAEKMRQNIGGRPKSDNPKVAVSIRLDREIVEKFKAGGPGWQTRINDALKEVAGL